ncbi:MAG: hypothetical protein NUV46_03010 [Nanoarchaeota archaeon]|nr:hypothetical protein [Nanoarchaeota archaeon]
MVKGGVKSKTSKQESYKRSLSHARETEKLLVENFVSLQKVLVNLSGKFDDLTRQISELLKLFEDSAKIIVKNEMEKKKEDKGERELLDTMISVLDQNKVIARGLTLIYESMNGGSSPQKIQVMPERKEETLEKRKLVKEDKDYSFSKAVRPSPGPYPPRT